MGRTLLIIVGLCGPNCFVVEWIDTYRDELRRTELYMDSTYYEVSGDTLLLF